jgi:serine protease inhibitor
MHSYNSERREKKFTENDKLYNRNFSSEHKPNDVDRLCLEREFGKSSFDEKSNDSKQSNRSNQSMLGEITGKKKVDENIGRGMPMRSQYTVKKSTYDENKYLDFNLTAKAPKSKIQYNDTSFSGPHSSFADINMSTTTLTNQIDPMYILRNSVGKIGTNINEYFMKVLQNSYIINTFGLYSLFGCLYLASDHITQNELGKFFNYPKKDILNSNLLKIHKNVEKLNDMINVKNLIVSGNNIPYNQEFTKMIDKFCVFIRVDITNPTKESEKLNTIINRMTQTILRNPVVPSNLENLQLMFMTVGVVHPIWTYPFEKIVKSKFIGIERDRSENFLVSFSKSYLYFEDNENQLIEFKCGDKGNGMGFGIILPKKTQVLVSNENIHHCISHAKATVLDEVRIPMFSQDLKLRYNNTLKNLGLNSVFLQITAEEFFPKRVQLHDIIQNIKIVVDGSSLGETDNTRGYRSIHRFIADKPFMYYIRLIQTDAIIMNGLYI